LGVLFYFDNDRGAIWWISSSKNTGNPGKTAGIPDEKNRIWQSCPCAYAGLYQWGIVPLQGIFF
jgi:hypothetical protein